MGKKKGKKPPSGGAEGAAGPSQGSPAPQPPSTEAPPVGPQGNFPEIGARKMGKKKSQAAATKTLAGPSQIQPGPSGEPGAPLQAPQEPVPQKPVWSPPQQQPFGGPPPQQQGPRGPPQQQGPRGPPQQQGPRGPPPQQGPKGPPQQQGPRGPPQQQGQTHQKPETEIRPAAVTGSAVSSSTSEQSLISISKGLADMSAGGKAPKVAATGLMIPRRKSKLSCGTMGRKTFVDTNYLAFDLSQMVPKLYHYDVTIDPDRPKRLMRTVLNEFQRRHFPNRFTPFDGKKNMYTATPLPFPGHAKTEEVIVRDAERDRDKTYTVTVKLAREIDTSVVPAFVAGKSTHTAAQHAINALDIILRHASCARLTPVGRSFFSKPEGQIMDLGDGMECWIGFFQSVIMGWKPFVNIDVAHKGFPKEQDCIGVIRDLFGHEADVNRELNNYQKDDFVKYIRELKVNYEIPGQPNTKRTYRVNGIGKSAAAQFFEMEDGKNVTVQLYYKHFKRYELKFPNMPCLDVGSPNREKKILIPCELCRMVGGQVVVKKMTEKQTTNLIRLAATSTDDRRRKIMDAINKVNFASDPCLKEFKLRVNDKFERVAARVLEPPLLQYKSEEPVKPDRGVWRSKPFLDGKVLRKWTILSMAKWVREEQLRDFVQQMRRQASTMGMSIDPPQEPINTIIQLHEKPKLEDFLKRRKDLELIFVVVQDSGDSYARLKQMAENTVGVLTQCLKSRTLSRMNPATCGNILLKVNAKLNGLNHTLGAPSRPPCLRRPVMIVGADVTHPSPDQTNRPSVAAVCASHEPKAFKYNMQYRLQPARAEIIEDLEEVMRIQLRYFERVNNGLKPEKIIFYRDGVSEGQFQEVLNKEFMAIRRACQSLNPEYQPAITFMVVQKRHHTRFFPTNRMDSDGRNNNVPAGTIVDTVITHPTDLDFFLVSHASIQGVSRPTKYRRLWDDSNMGEDELEALTYYLCHMFTRCTRSVSYPAPTYYAHLAAYRAGCYLQDGQRIAMSDLSREQLERTIKEEIITNSPMFFV